MTLVYIVTSGDYDISIRGVFSKEKLAKIVKDSIPDSNRIYIWKLNDFGCDINTSKKILGGFKLFCIWMNKDGKITNDVDMVDPLIKGYKDSRLFDRDYSGGYNKDAPVTWYNEWELYCWGKNEEEAIRKANKKRLALLKNGSWFLERSL